MGKREYDKRACQEFVGTDVGDYMKLLTRLLTKNLSVIGECCVEESKYYKMIS